MAKLSLTTITSGYASVDALNTNFDAIETALENTLSRDGTSPNTMSADLDMNSQRILNLPEPVNQNEPARLADVLAGIAGASQANLVTFTPAGTIAANTVQGAIEEIDNSISTFAYTLLDDTTAADARATLGAAASATSVQTGAATASGLTMATSRLLGRTTASTGAIEELSVGSSLTLSGGSLSGTAASDSQAGVIEVAVQSEMEAGSSTTLATTPGRQHYHPSAAKAWAKFNGTTVGTNAPTAGYNVTTVTRNSAGSYTINLTNAFSSADYVVVGIGTSSPYALAFASSTASTFTVNTFNTGTGTLTDVASVFVVAFGDL